jgi:hypothetical protein
MSVAPNAGIVDFGTFTSPTTVVDGIQGQVPQPLAGQETFILTAIGWVPSSNAGNNSLINPTFSYTNGRLTSVVYGSGQTKTLTYSDGVLTQLDFYNLINTIRKTFNYTGGVLTSITQVTL